MGTSQPVVSVQWNLCTEITSGVICSVVCTDKGSLYTSAM